MPGLRSACAIALAGALLLLILARHRTALHTPDAPSPEVGDLPRAKVEINHATAAEISVLPGIGPALAARIVDDRACNGAFQSLQDLSRIPGIGPAITERIAPFISLQVDEESGGG